MKLIAILVFIISGSVLADEKVKGEKFEAHKKAAVSHLEKRISNLQRFKSCIASASNREAIKSCRMKHKEVKNSLQAERKAKKKK